jgi:hypothetical protein
VNKHLQTSDFAFDGARRRMTAATIAGVFAVYVGAISTLHPSVFWSPDEGAKFIQMVSRHGGKGAGQIAYAALEHDPDLVFYPSHLIYPQPVAFAGVRYHWPGAFPALSFPFFRLIGPWGLYVVPLACGFLTACMTGFIARRIDRNAAVPAMLLAGFATPLLFHACLFLEHTLTCALLAGALLFACLSAGDSVPRRVSGLAGVMACMAAAFALRDEVLIVVAAAAASLVIVFAPARARAFVLALTLAAFSFALFFKPEGPEPATSGRIAAMARDSAKAITGMLDPGTWKTLPRHVLRTVFSNPDDGGVPLPEEWAAAGIVGLALCVIARFVVPRLRMRCWLTGAGLVGAAAAMGLCISDRYRAMHGIIMPMPAIVLAFLPAPRAAKAGKLERFLDVFFPLYLCADILGTWALHRSTGGPEWGSRYVLPIFVPASIMGAVAVTRLATSARRPDRLPGLLVSALLCLLSCGFEIRGIFEVQVTKRDLAAFEREIVACGRPVVTDRWWLAAALAPLFVHTEFFTINPGSDPLDWLDAQGKRVGGFVAISYSPPPLCFRSRGGYEAVMVQRRIVQNMTFSLYDIRQTP